MSPNRYCIKKAWMLFQVMLVSIILQAQEPGTSQDDSNDATESHTNIYFLQKNQQPNGGGPDAVRWKKLPDTLVKRLQGEDDFWFLAFDAEVADAALRNSLPDSGRVQ